MEYVFCMLVYIWNLKYVCMREKFNSYTKYRPADFKGMYCTLDNVCAWY